MIIEFLDGDLESRIIELIGDFRDYESLIGGLFSQPLIPYWLGKTILTFD